jgi:hypothetical protein
VGIKVAQAIGVLVGFADAHDLAGGSDDFDFGLAGLIVNLTAAKREPHRRPGQAHGPLGLGAGEVQRQAGQQRQEKRLERQIGPVDMNSGAQKQHGAGADYPLREQRLTVVELDQHATGGLWAPGHGEVLVDEHGPEERCRFRQGRERRAVLVEKAQAPAFDAPGRGCRNATSGAGSNWPWASAFMAL